MGRKPKSQTRAEDVQDDGAGTKLAGANHDSPGTRDEAAGLKTAIAAVAPETTRECERVELDMSQIVPSPDQYAAVDTKSDDFAKLKASIAAPGVGILEDLLVRPHKDGNAGLQGCRDAVGIKLYELLSGHSRLEAAKQLGIRRIPVKIIHGLSDAQAFDVLALANLRKNLTPFEWGKMVAIWLDKYGQDTKAVASKLGKTEHWVISHAQIERNLIRGWREEAVHQEPTNQYNDYHRRDYSHWTAEHWRHIARLPAALQEYWLGKIQKDYRFDPHDATAGKVAEWLETEKLFLAKAPFDAATSIGKPTCVACPKRTDAISQLLWHDPDIEAKEGDAAVRCLDPECWGRKGERVLQDRFTIQAVEINEKYCREHHGSLAHPVVPISMIEEPKDWERRQRYEATMGPVKRAFGKALVTADRITIVKEGTKGAVPGIVVAGDKKHRKNSLLWVRIEAKKEGGGSPGGPHKLSAAEEVVRAVYAQIAKKNLADQPEPKLAIVLAACEIECHRTNPGQVLRVFKKGTDQFFAWITETKWNNLITEAKSRARYGGYYDKDVAVGLAKLLGIDAETMYQDLEAGEGKKDGKDARRREGRQGQESEIRTPKVREDKTVDDGDKAQGIEDGRKPSGPRVIELPRVLKVHFPPSYHAKCEIRVQRIEDRWCGGFEITVGKETIPLPIRTADPHMHATKAACLKALVISIGQALDSKRLLIRQVPRVEIQRAIEKRVDEELAERTCRICGCTKDDCSPCVEKMGSPCTWVEDDLCSACVGKTHRAPNGDLTRCGRGAER